ncbi:MAG TPA: (2Fe-2S)-binding protein [Dongiaceae bacterium]|nr:(2Fe-2S)-binding protein [Dongiaceae bacterium]
MGFGKVTRRRFLLRAVVPAVAAGAGLGSPRLSAAVAAVTSVSVLPATGPGPIPVTLNVNGQSHALSVEPRVTLLDALRERLQLTGTKKGCDQGTCGACTVLVDGRRVNACLTLAVMAQGKAITTVEGLAKGEQLHPVQAAFLAHDGFQCGYCTPGQIMSAVALLGEKRDLDEGSVREWMSGNICRCGAYPNIVAAVRAAGGVA